MKHIKKFNESIGETLKVSAKDMEIFASKGTNPNYPGLEYESDTNEGDFDSEKGAMTDYPVYLYEDGKRIWVGSGGYYTGVTGECHNYPITFDRYHKPESIEKTAQDLATEIINLPKDNNKNQVDYVATMILDWYKKNSNR